MKVSALLRHLALAATVLLWAGVIAICKWVLS